MELTSYVAMSYLSVQQRALDVTAMNLANAGTSGFKAERVLFSDWLAKQSGTDNSRGGKPVAFVQDRATWREKAEGTLQHTNNPLDLAIGSADGFFTVETPRGTRLTRAGRFTAQGDGTITDPQGNALLDTAGQKLRISPADITLTVTADGTISSENGTIGKIAIVQPDDPAKLQTEGGALLNPNTPTTPVAIPRIVQGATEDSNVQPILEMTRMMSGLRSFQFTSQLVEQEAQRQQGAIDKLTQRKD